MGLLPANFQLPTRFHSQRRVLEQALDRRTDNGHHCIQGRGHNNAVPRTFHVQNITSGKSLELYYRAEALSDDVHLSVYHVGLHQA